MFELENFSIKSGVNHGLYLKGWNMLNADMLFLGLGGLQ